MLRAITQTNSGLVFNVDSDEFAETDLPDGLLDQSELDTVKIMHPKALPDYKVKQPVMEEFVDGLDTSAT